MTLRTFYNVDILQSSPPVGDADLDQCQEVLGITFPPGYRQFLRRCNGGKPRPGCFLINYVVRPSIEAFNAINASDLQVDLVTDCRRLREQYQLPPQFLPIARCKGDTVLLLSCADQDGGSLHYWPDIEPGHSFGEFFVIRLYFPIEQLSEKLGPVKNRDDVDDAFFRLHYSASRRHGGRVAQELVDQGYDINFVIPGFTHPIFTAVLCHEFAVAEILIQLGTRADHVDDDGVTALQRLLDSLDWWKCRKAEHRTRDSMHAMADRRIRHIESALRILGA